MISFLGDSVLPSAGESFVASATRYFCPQRQKYPKTLLKPAV